MASISDGESGSSARTKINASIAITDAISSTGSGSIITTAERSKLDGIEASADVTDATNVDAAGAVMNTDTTTAAMSFVVDEDDMLSNSATKVPTQQSVKAYADTKLARSGGTLTGDLDVNGNNITGYTASKVLTSDSSGNITPATATTTELSYLEGTTSAIQTQLDAKADLSGATFTGNIIINNNLPILELKDTSGALSDENRWQIRGDDGILKIQGISDSGSGGGSTINFNRTGNLIDSITFKNSGIDKITLNTDGTATFAGAITSGAVTYPTTDGTANQVLKTNGSGTVSFGSVALSETTGTADNITEGSTNLFLTTAERSKLSGIEASADVTDAINVDAAGAVMNSDTTTASMSFVIDEDNMGSNSATKVPTQQSVKAYADLMLPLAGGTMSGDVSLDSNNITNGQKITSNQFTRTHQTLTYGTSVTWDTSGGQAATITLTGNVTTFSFSNISVGEDYTLKVVQDGDGSKEIGWASNVYWAGGTVPTLSTGPNFVDLIKFYSDGTNVYGQLIGLNFR